MSESLHKEAGSTPNNLTAGNKHLDQYNGNKTQKMVQWGPEKVSKTGESTTSDDVKPKDQSRKSSALPVTTSNQQKGEKGVPRGLSVDGKGKADQRSSKKDTKDVGPVRRTMLRKRVHVYEDIDLEPATAAPEEDVYRNVKVRYD